jgi:serine phosphatase RsbU (regulator of sigma subunit)
MSIVGQNLLNQAVNEHGLSRPNLVLNALNKEVSRTLGANEASQVTDGMDIALCSIDMDTMMLQFAGAFNPAWILRQGEIIELRGDKFPIGSFVDSGVRNFQNIEFQLQEGDIVYVFTDGYADQFGGPKGKKFKYKNIKSLLIENASASMSDQKMILERTIRDWKGDLEQIDDILVMGVRVGRKAAVSF